MIKVLQENDKRKIIMGETSQNIFIFLLHINKEENKVISLFDSDMNLVIKDAQIELNMPGLKLIGNVKDITPEKIVTSNKILYFDDIHFDKILVQNIMFDDGEEFERNERCV